MKQWVLAAGTGIDKLQVKDVPIPEVEENEVLVKFHTVSLNYRDVVIARSDGAGEAVATGPKATLFRNGERVSPTYFQGFHTGILTVDQAERDLAGHLDGVLGEYGVFRLTAWNALYGGGKSLRPGETVLTQGIGGVSEFAVQFALAGGAQVIATTSSDDKGKALKTLGVHHVINYKGDREWGQTARKLSLGQRGANYIAEIGGLNTFSQFSIAAAIEGTVAVVGTRGGKDQSDSSSVHTNMFSTRRIMAGNRLQFEDINRAIVANDIKSMLDKKSFRFGQVVEAYHYLKEQQTCR